MVDTREKKQCSDCKTKSQKGANYCWRCGSKNLVAIQETITRKTKPETTPIKEEKIVRKNGWKRLFIILLIIFIFENLFFYLAFYPFNSQKQTIPSVNVSYLETIIANKDIEIINLKNEITNLKNQPQPTPLILTIENENDDRSEINNLKSQISNLQVELAKNNTSLSAKETEITSLKAEIDNLNRIEQQSQQADVKTSADPGIDPIIVTITPLSTSGKIYYQGKSIGRDFGNRVSITCGEIFFPNTKPTDYTFDQKTYLASHEVELTIELNGMIPIAFGSGVCVKDLVEANSGALVLLDENHLTIRLREGELILWKHLSDAYLDVYYRLSDQITYGNNAYKQPLNLHVCSAELVDWLQLSDSSLENLTILSPLSQ